LQAFQRADVALRRVVGAIISQREPVDQSPRSHAAGSISAVSKSEKRGEEPASFGRIATPLGG
jgi:hypothetical protein